MSADLNQKNPLPLGQMESMAPECTPLKEKYDTCFHTWFKDYLDVSSVLHEGASNQADRWHVRGSLFSASNNQVHKIAALRARYDNDCKSLFTEYQACVKVWYMAKQKTNFNLRMPSKSVAWNNQLKRRGKKTLSHSNMSANTLKYQTG